MAASVLRWYFELEDGYIPTADGPRFDPRVLDYRVDVDLVLRKFHPAETLAITLLHRDGFTAEQALQVAGLNVPSLEDVEIRMGAAFERRGLDEFLKYVDYLR